MKVPAAHRHPVKLLFSLILTSGFMLSDAASLRNKKVEILTVDKYVQLANTIIPALGEFTFCLDLYRISATSSWTAFTYHTDMNNGQVQELGLIGLNKKLHLFHLRGVFEVPQELPLEVWHTVCSTWSSLDGRLQLYLNGTSILDTTANLSQALKPSGSLVLGINHVTDEGVIKPVNMNNFIGYLYNFQMWDYVRLQNELNDCTDGNVVSWREEFWNFHKTDPEVDMKLRCAFSEDLPTPESPTASSASIVPVTTTRESEDSTTILVPKTELTSPSRTVPPIGDISSVTSTYISTSHVMSLLTTMIQSDNSNTTKTPISTSLPSVATTQLPQSLMTTNSWLPTISNAESSNKPLMTQTSLPTDTDISYSAPSATTTMDDEDHSTEMVLESESTSTFSTMSSDDDVTSSWSSVAVSTYLSTFPVTNAWTTLPEHETNSDNIAVSKTLSPTPISEWTQPLVTTHAELATITSTESSENSAMSEPSSSTDTDLSDLSSPTSTEDPTAKSIPNTENILSTGPPVGDITPSCTSVSTYINTFLITSSLTTEVEYETVSAIITNSQTFSLTATSQVSSSVVPTYTDLETFTTTPQYEFTKTAIIASETSSSVTASEVPQSLVTTHSGLATIIPIVSSEQTSISKPSSPTETASSLSERTTRRSEDASTTLMTETDKTSTTVLPNGDILTSTSADTSLSTITQHGTTTSNKTPSMDSSSATTSQTAQSTMATHSGLATTIPTNSDTSSSKTSLPTDTVTFYMVLMNISVLTTQGTVNVELVTNLTEHLLSSTLKDTEFAVFQFTVNNNTSLEPWEAPVKMFIIKKRDTSEDSLSFLYNTKVIIKAVSPKTPESLAEKLDNLLESQDDNLENLSIMSLKVQIIDPGSCPANVTYSSEKGLYRWMEKKPTQTARAPCRQNPQMFATRFCNINITNTFAEWENPVLDLCQSIQRLPDTIKELQDVIVTQENAKDLLEHIFNLTIQSDTLNKEETDIILSKLSEIVALTEMDQSSAQISLDIVNILLKKADDLRSFTNRILNITEEIGYKMTFPGDTANITSQRLVLSVSKVDFNKFEDIFFTVTSYLEGKEPEITLQKIPFDKAVAFLYLPGSIREQVVLTSSKVQFNFFGKTSLFEDHGSSDIKLNTYVVSASVVNSKIQDLNDPVDITLKHLHPITVGKPMCVFWDFNLNDGTGGWDGSGCKVKFTNINYTTCHCTHLTHFGVLLDLSRSEINPWDDRILSILTYVGCGTASVFLGIALVTYLAFEPLRKDYPSKILMNLSSSLLMLNLVFLVNNWISSFRNYGLCISCAALLHYFLLASFTWMGLEAIHMYFALVKVFNVYVHNYILKFCITGWGLPAIVVAIVLIIKRDFYGSGSNFQEYSLTTDSSPVLFCWIQNDLVFYLTVVGFFCVIFLINTSMMIVVILQINSIKSKRMKSWKELFLHDLKSTISLAFLLGLTWGFAFFAWGPVRVAFLYLFSIFNTLQGFFIFVFHCLMKENVRKQWRMHLCCGRFRLDNFSDWSRLSNAEAKQNGQAHKVQSIRSNTTNSTTTSSASDFSRDPPPERGYRNGGIFMNSAHLVTTSRAAIHPDNRRILSFVELERQ